MSEEADRLLAALDAAPDDATRQALIAGCPRELLDQLDATLVYRKLQADGAADLAAFDAFTAELDAARDDAHRLRIIAAAGRDPQRGAGFVSEWSWRRTASTNDWLNRYLAMCREGAS